MPLRLPLCSLLVVASLAIAGCGGGAYEETFAATKKNVDRLRPYRALRPPASLFEDKSNTSVTARLPLAFDRAPFNKESTTRTEADRAESDRAFPPFLGNNSVPGWQNTYEAFATDDEKKTPLSFYLYVGVQPKKGNKDPAKQIMDVMKRFADVKYETVELTGPDESKVSWQRFDLEFEQDFRDSSNNIRQKVPGRFEVYLYEKDPDNTILLIWRIPTEIQKKVNLNELAKLTAGTLKITAPPPKEEPAKDPAAK